MRSGIVCSGVSCLDLFLYDTTPLHTRESLSMVRTTQYRPGGATSNTGRALARLGMPVSYLTVLGVDANGDIMESMWRADGVDTSCVVRVETAGTALSVLPVYTDGKRGVYFCPGTNDIMDADNLFGPGQQYLQMLGDCQAFHFGYPPLLRCLQGEALADLLRLVRDTGVLVSLDTTPVATNAEQMRILGPALPVAHMFTPNVMEAA
ncbi:MAG: carbohydrate kinase family protein, partial [bacterium]